MKEKIIQSPIFLLPSKMQSRLLSIFLLFSLLHIVIALKPLAAVCKTVEEFSSGDQFDNNLIQLMFHLAIKAPKVGFEIASVGSDHGRVNGLALCRGDIGSGRCFRCFNRAMFHVQSNCQRKKDAVIWLDNCMLRYSNEEFFGEIDSNHTVLLRETRNAANPIEFDKNVIVLMNKLMNKAYISPLLFATGQREIQSVGRLFGLVQCTKDLSGGDCKTCLKTAISQISQSWGGTIGGGILGGSCSVRYELYQFFDY
jgi:Salt stress response/antifungal